MRKITTMRNLKLLIVFVLGLLCTTTLAQRKMEKLDRGLVAVQTSGGVFLSWRMFGTDPQNVSFNIYRDGTKINSSPITGATNMTDAAGLSSSTYTVRPIIAGEEKAVGGTAEVWSSWVHEIQLQGGRPSGTHRPNDINVGDLDGDGEYELVLKWYPDNAQDNSRPGTTANTYLAAYKLDGSRLWIIDLGRNIRSGAHYTQHLVGDYDSDGYAEVACKTAPGTRDGTGGYLRNGPAANDNDEADYRNGNGYILSGPEYLTIFNGQTGEEMATVNYVPSRGGSISEINRLWGDNYGNRVDRFNSTNAYLDGIHPSMIFQRGYYTRMVIAAFDWDGTTLTNRWTFDSDQSGSGGARGQGNHSIMAADVDGDGKDEILPGSCAIDDDGSYMYRTGHGHGDANHVGDFVPGSPGLEVFQVSENEGSEPNHYMYRGSNGDILWQSSESGNDNGRGMTADIDANYEGSESWSSSVGGTIAANGSRISNSKPGSTNFRIYWDGDLLDEIPTGSSNNTNNAISKWGSNMNIGLTGRTCNGTKATPNISADIIGDWREEVILHDNGTTLYLHTTTIPTDYKLYTLMHDPVYRNAISWQQSSYNQPPHLGFWLGANNAPQPDIVVVGGVDCNGIENGDAYIDQCGECVGGNTGKEACYLDCHGDRDGTAKIDACGVCAGGNTGLTACAGSIQGEDFCEATGVQESSNAGYVGSGYLNFDNQTGASGNWNIIASSTGTYQLAVHYANGGATARSMNIVINNAPQGTFNAATTGGWTTWQVETVTLNLNAGVNNIALVATTTDGGPNVDQLTWTENTLTAGGCEVDCNGVLGGNAYTDDCNECVGGNTGKIACEQDCHGDWGGTASVDACGMCTGGNTGQIACTQSIQAEVACEYDGTIDNNNQGYHGEGFVNTPNEVGAHISLSLHASETVASSLGFVYANGGTTDRSVTVILNGNTAGTLIFSTTGDWEVWESENINLNLVQGTNIIELVATTTGGIPNLDQLNVYGSEVTQGSCATDCHGDLGGNATTDVCGKCVGGNTGASSEDADGDGILDCEDTNPNDHDNDGVTTIDDCDDNNANIGAETTWYLDADNDGVGVATTTTESCVQPSGYVAESGDECPNDQFKTSPGDCGCGVTEESCLDCAGTPHGTEEYDDCGVCGGSNACVDCHGEPHGGAAEDACGTCAGGSTGIDPVTDPQDCIATSIDEYETQHQIVYPNPTTGDLHISNSSSWILLDMTGAELERGDASVLSLADYTPGVYLLRIDNEVIKVIKE